MLAISECPAAADQKPESTFLRPRKSRGAADGDEDLSSLTRIGFSASILGSISSSLSRLPSPNQLASD